MSAFERLGRWAARRRWWVVGAWLALLIVAVPLALQTSGALRSGGFIREDLESARSKQLLHDEIGLPEAAVAVVLHSKTLRAGEPAFELAAAEAVAAVPGAPHVVASSRTCWPRARSRSTDTRPTTSSSSTCRPTIRRSPCRSCAALRHARGLEVELAGGPAFYGDVQTVSESDLRRSEIISLPLAALALLLVFGSVVAAGVPLVVGGAAVLVALAAIFVVAGAHADEHLRAQPRDAPRARPRRRLLAADDEPIPRGAGGAATGRSRTRSTMLSGVTVATAGRAVFFCGLTVLLGLLGLVLFEFMILRSVGIAGAIVVGLAVARGAHAAARAPDHRRPPDRSPSRSGRSAPQAARTDRGHASRNRVMRRPVAVLVPTLGILLLLGSPFLHVRFNAPDASILPASVPSRVAFDRLTAAFGEGEFAPIVLAVRTDRAGHDAGQPRPRSTTTPRRLAADPRVVAGRQPRRRRSAPDARPVPAPVRRPNRSARTDSCSDGARGHDPRRPHGLHDLHAVRPQPRARAGRSFATCAIRAGPLAPPAGLTVLVGGGAADVDGRRRRASPRTSRGPPCSSS